MGKQNFFLLNTSRIVSRCRKNCDAGIVGFLSFVARLRHKRLDQGAAKGPHSFNFEFILHYYRFERQKSPKLMILQNKY